jgi:hypothetical protein
MSGCTTDNKTIKATGSVSITSYLTGSPSVTYGTTFSNSTSTKVTSTKATITPLPASTGAYTAFPTIDFTAYSNPILNNNPTVIIPSGGTQTYSSGTTTLPSLADVQGNVTLSSSPTIKTAANTAVYISGNLNISGNSTWNCSGNLTLYVHGNVGICNNGGSFSMTSPSGSKVYIVSDGSISVGGGYNFGSTHMYLFSSTSVSMSSSNPSNCWVYAHNSAGTASYTGNSSQITGAVMADSINLSGSGDVYSTPDSGIPGTGTVSTGWIAQSWEEVY